MTSEPALSVKSLTRLPVSGAMAAGSVSSRTQSSFKSSAATMTKLRSPVACRIVFKDAV